MGGRGGGVEGWGEGGRRKAGWGIGQTRGTSLRPGWPGTARLRPPAGLGRSSLAPAYSSLFPLVAGAFTHQGEIGMREQDDRSRKRQPPGPDPRAAALPQPVRASSGRHLTPRGVKRQRGELSSRRLASRAPSPSCLFRDASEENSESLPRAGLQGERQSRDLEAEVKGARKPADPRSRFSAPPSLWPDAAGRRLGIAFGGGPRSQQPLWKKFGAGWDTGRCGS